MLRDTNIKQNFCDNYFCDSTAVINDLVYLSDSIDNTIIVANNNLSSTPVIGFIKSKFSNTIAVVYYFGKFNNAIGLITGKKVFVGTDGLPTTTVPLTGYIQTIGISISTTEFIFETNLNRTLRS